MYPFKTIEAGAVVNTSVIWESRGKRNLFGPRGVSGLVNVEITAELCVRLASAYATTLKKGEHVVTSRDCSLAARALKRAVIGALTAYAINVLDLEAAPLPVARFHTAREAAGGGIALRTTPGDPQSVDIVIMDDRGADLPRRPSASWSGSSPARSSAAPSPARSPSSPIRPGPSRTTPTSCCATSAWAASRT